MQEGIEEESVVLLHRGDGLSNKKKKKNLYLATEDCSLWTFFFLFLPFSAMGRRPEINHSQLQGKQRQSDDMPQETVSFVCNAFCSKELLSKCSD